MNQETWEVPNHTVQLTATRKDDSNFAFAAKYNDIPVDSVSISGDGVSNGKLTLKSGESVQLTTTVKPDNATNKKVIWTSSDSAIADVSNTGLVKVGTRAGTTKITATAGDTNASITIAVSGQTDRDVLDALASSHRSDLADGTYVVASALDGGKALDVSSGSYDNGANVQLWDSNETEAQKWTVSHDKNDYVTLTNTGSGKALDVSYGKAYEEANIQQWEFNDTRAQKWIAVRSKSRDLLRQICIHFQQKSYPNLHNLNNLVSLLQYAYKFVLTNLLILKPLQCYHKLQRSQRPHGHLYGYNHLQRR